MLMLLSPLHQRDYYHFWRGKKDRKIDKEERPLTKTRDEVQQANKQTLGAWSAVRGRESGDMKSVSRNPKLGGCLSAGTCP